MSQLQAKFCFQTWQLYLKSLLKNWKNWGSLRLEDGGLTWLQFKWLLTMAQLVKQVIILQMSAINFSILTRRITSARSISSWQKVKISLAKSFFTTRMIFYSRWVVMMTTIQKAEKKHLWSLRTSDWSAVSWITVQTISLVSLSSSGRSDLISRTKFNK